MSCSPGTPELTPPREGVDSEMQAAAVRAVGEAEKRYGVELDFSPESISALEEKILASLHRRHLEAPFESSEFNRNAVLWGAYIGETMKLSIEDEAHWEQDSEFGQYTFPLHWGGGASFPVLWCVARLRNGQEDNVWNKFRYFALGEYSPDEMRIIENPIEDPAVQEDGGVERVGMESHEEGLKQEHAPDG